MTEYGDRTARLLAMAEKRYSRRHALLFPAVKVLPIDARLYTLHAEAQATMQHILKKANPSKYKRG